MPSARSEFEYFGLRTVYDRYLLKHPTRGWCSRRRSISSCASPALQHHGARGARALRSCSRRSSTCRARRRCSTAGTRHEQLSSCFLLDSPHDPLEAIYERYNDVALLSKFSGGIGLAYHRVRSRGSLIREHQRPLQRHRALAEDARRLGRRGQPGRQAQGRLLRLSRDLARRHRGVPRAARQHRRRGAPHAQPEPRQLDPRSVHAARRGRRRLVASSIPRTCRSCPTSSARRSMSAYVAGGGPRAWRKKTLKARELYARMMRTLAQTGNGWMTFKDKSNRACNQTAPARARRAPLEPVHRDPRGHLAAERRRSATSARSTWPATSDGDGLRLRQARAHRANGGPAARSGDRPQLLPDRARRGRRTMRWRPVGLGVMGLQDVFFQLRLPFDAPRRASSVDADLGGDLLPRAARPLRSGARARARIRPSPRRAPRAASCSSMPGA